MENEYTAGDFAEARFADHPVTGARAHRGDDGRWFNYSVGEPGIIGVDGSDADMAEWGWVPVHQADGSDRVAERQKLIDHVASLDAVIRRRNDQIERLENQFEKADRQRSELAEQVAELRGAHAPVSLDALRTAWANAEVTNADNPPRPGDVVIAAMIGGGYEVYTTQAVVPGLTRRVLSRAPREPWADLADMLRGTAWEQMTGMGADTIAETLHAQGVRVTGGDDQ